MFKNWQKRTQLLLGDVGLEKLQNSHVAVFGIGGVGGYTAEMLVRAGIGTITVVDFDVVDETNINRQIIATTKTVGESKCNAMEERLLSINPNLIIHKKNVMFNASTLDFCFSEKYNYVVDAIDMVTSKTLLIEHCIKNNINIVSAMGAGNRKDIPTFKVCNIFKTFNDGLAKVMRKNLKSLGITKHMCVFTESLPENCGEEVGSISYYPAMAGCVISAYVINELIK